MREIQKIKKNQLLTIEEVQEEAKFLSSGWEVAKTKLKKTFLFPDFKEAVAFVHAVANIAQQLQHHPEILLSWKKVVIETTTHSIGGLSNKDFDLAKKIDAESETF